jgi:hypothetical protein
METILIGIDDTDNDASPGTGHMARILLAECIRRGMKAVSITRHQLLVDSRIPYTSHNSSACVAVEASGPAAAEFAMDFVGSRSAEGSDPGVCICRQDDAADEIRHFGLRATREVLEMAEAMEIAARLGVALRPLGGTGLGVIGALSAVGLRAGGQDGRVIDMPGLRELPDRVSAGELMTLGIGLAHEGLRPASPGDAYATLGWVRPRMVAGRAVLPVTWSEQHNAWIPVDRKRSRPLD